MRMNVLKIMGPLLAFILLYWVASRITVSEADKDRQAREIATGRIEFLPNPRGFWGAYVLLGLMSYPVVSLVVSGFNSAIGLWFVAFCLGFMVMFLMVYPGSITASGEGLEQNYWLGSLKRIAWKEVSSISVDDKRKRVTISSARGVKIVHTRQLPDKARLFAELQMHCPQRMPVEVAQEISTGAYR